MIKKSETDFCKEKLESDGHREFVEKLGNIRYIYYCAMAISIDSGYRVSRKTNVPDLQRGTWTVEVLLCVSHHYNG